MIDWRHAVVCLIVIRHILIGMVDGMKGVSLIIRRVWELWCMQLK